MLKPKTRWVVKEVDEGLKETLQNQLQLSPLLSQLLVARGMDTAEKATAFLQGAEKDFYDPFLLSDMDKAIERTKQAIEYGEPILIYGDYDADGVTSTSILIHTLRQAGAVFQYYIPNRFTEGYGLNEEALRKAAEKGFAVVITVDTGISAVKEAEVARELGLDLIITDHHEPPAQIPQAFAVINPKKPGCSYPFPMLAGAGVAFKFAHALMGSFPYFVLDIAGVGTIADLVPLVDENRLFAKYGLQAIEHSTNPGIQALKRVCGIESGPATAYHVGFGMGPRINATGRLDSADRAVKLLTTNNPEEAESYAQELDELNRERQELVEVITEDAIARVLQFPEEERNVLVVAGEEWNEGVIGIVASRLVEKYYRPTIVLSINKESGKAKGSARSIEGFNMYEALTACKELLPHFGGHPMAAGMTLAIEDIPALRTKLNALAKEWLTEEDYQPITKVDAVCSLSEMNLDTLKEIEKLAPFGIGNAGPRLLIKQVELGDIRAIGKEQNHMKCQFVWGEVRLDGIGFKMGDMLPELPTRTVVDVVGELTVNEWNQVRKPQLVIRDLSVPDLRIFDWRGIKNKKGKLEELVGKGPLDLLIFRPHNREKVPELSLPAEIRLPDRSELLESGRLVILYDLPFTYEELAVTLQRYPELEQIYCLFGEEKSHLPVFPSRNQITEIYKAIFQHKCLRKADLPLLAKAKGMDPTLVSFILAVFHELGFVRKNGEEYLFEEAAGKRELSDSRLYCQEQSRIQLETELLYASSKDLAMILKKYCQTSETIKEVVTHDH